MKDRDFVNYIERTIWKMQKGLTVDFKLASVNGHKN